ncbi:TetR/AcrR family transcriptional regulator [Saccharothrix australiensis]|uniref:TetR/AcrR family transcriptional regulator n=1 Tax=Saccharothrix australiensis TaxID=2072 RepID=UPI001FE8BCAB|nr:TetR/AcrR family transcriptional regulator [Saccharothrix australiensis]
MHSVWLRPRRVPKGEPPLTLARIVEAAVALLDEEGIDRLTMRRLADRLAVAAPSLYWHVDTKDDVIDLAVDAIFGEVPVAGGGGGGGGGGGEDGRGDDWRGEDWRAGVTAVVTAWRTALLRHPWAAAVPARRRPTIGPNFLARMEVLQATLVRGGLSGTRLAAAAWALYNHVFGSAGAQTALRITDEERRVGQAKLTADRDRYPTLADNGYLYDDDWDGSFATGLEFLLDGIAGRAGRGS